MLYGSQYTKEHVPVTCIPISSFLCCVYVYINFILFLVTGLLSSAILKKLSDDASYVNDHALSIDLREHSR